MNIEQAVTTLPIKGYLDLPVPTDIDLVQEILRIKEEKNAIILAHYYQTPDIQDIADFLGDSLQLAREAQNTEADIILFCGVHFMAEAAKILNPTKKVLLPDLLAGCSLADACSGEGLRELKAQHPGSVVVTYINCDAGTKAASDYIVTSSNAEHIINQIPKDKKIIFAPDKNLGAYLMKQTGRDMILWDGVCIVHEAFSFERIAQQLMENPEAKLIAHPESDATILEMSEFVGSTSRLLDYVEHDEAQTFIVATEEGIIHEMQKRAPHKTLIPAFPKDETCACSECFYMKRNTMEKLYLSLKYELPEIQMDEQLRKEALIPIQKMLDMSKKIK